MIDAAKVLASIRRPMRSPDLGKATRHLPGRGKELRRRIGEVTWDLFVGLTAKKRGG